MRLSGLLRPGHDPALPCLVWLHGFLGNYQEWFPVASAFSRGPQLFLDLPGHGDSAAIRVQDFAQMDDLLRDTLASYGIQHYWLIGYSLGGRVALYHAFHTRSVGLCGLVIEGSHPGLVEQSAREARWHHDCHWARRLHCDPLREVLIDWYQQPVFSSLSATERSALCGEREQNDAKGLAAMLLATSLARQPDLRGGLHDLRIPLHYVCGERDTKFRAVAEQDFPVSPRLILGAGHNAHRQAPLAFRAQLLPFFSEYSTKEYP